MLKRLKNIKIVQSFYTLKGNTKTTVIFEPLFCISYPFYSFYLSLYIREMGVTDSQIGGIIAAGFLSSAFFSLFGGVFADFWGRKKTTFIFDLISWPIAIFIFLISRSYLMFILATIINNTGKIVSVSWNLMIVEDADSQQRKAAYNILSIINIAAGITTPIAGFFVAKMGVIRAERIFMVFAIITMSTMMILRNMHYTETKTGKKILAANEGLKMKEFIKSGLYGNAVRQLKTNRKLLIVFLLQILFNLTLPLGAYSSLYFAPYMTDIIGIDKADVSVFGTIYSGIMLFVFLVINPMVSRKFVYLIITIGLAFQGIAFLGISLLPYNAIYCALFMVGTYSLGYGLFLPLFNALFADVSDGDERAGIYALSNTFSAIFSAVVGSISGFIYSFQPRLIFLISFILIVICIITILLFIVYSKNREIKPQQ